MTKYDHITIYYDASCDFCATEIQNLKLYDSSNQMTLVDCSDKGFDDSPFANENITQEDMMNCLHIRNNLGQWYKGIEAFELMYQIAGFRRIAKLWSSPLTKPLATRLYPWIVRNRYLLSRLGAPQVLKVWGWFAARNASKKSQHCIKGQCTTEIKGGK